MNKCSLNIFIMVMHFLWLASLGATVTAICIYFLLLIYTKLLLYDYSVQTLFWSPETIEVCGCGGESGTEGSTQVVLCCVHLIARGGDVFFFVQGFLSLPGPTFPRLWFPILADRCSYSLSRLIGFDGCCIRV